jgi:hypothetical protein
VEDEGEEALEDSDDEEYRRSDNGVQKNSNNNNAQKSKVSEKMIESVESARGKIEKFINEKALTRKITYSKAHGHPGFYSAGGGGDNSGSSDSTAVNLGEDEEPEVEGEGYQSDED